MLALAPKSSASFVFTDIENNGGWSSDGVSWCVGLLTAAFGLTGELRHLRRFIKLTTLHKVSMALSI